MTNNYPELCGLLSHLDDLRYQLNMATREGTLKQVANRWKLVGDLSLLAEEKCNRLIFPPPAPKIPEEEVE